MIAKTLCPICKNFHNVEMSINPENIPGEMMDSEDWTRGIFRCIEVENVIVRAVIGYRDEDKLKLRIRELENDILKLVSEFENNYGKPVQFIEINKKSNSGNQIIRTNSVMVSCDFPEPVTEW